MSIKRLAASGLQCLFSGLAAIGLFQFIFGATLAAAAPAPANNDANTTSPIKHVIVIIGENRSFDHVFATYLPKNGQTVNNLLSEGIIKLGPNKQAVPGPNFSKAHQLSATQDDAFLLSPPKTLFPNDQLPAPLTGGPSGADGYFSGSTPCPSDPSLNAVDCALVSESGLPSLTYYQDLASGGTGLGSKVPDSRITNVTTLPAGPFQLTNGTTFPYNAYAASPVHRFYQMWQQEDCDLTFSTADNPSGCEHHLFSWVEATEGAGNNGVTQPPICNPADIVTPCFSENYLPGATTTGEGSTSLGFYNVQQGDVPYFTSLANNYAMSDNFHQSVDGGTGANHIMFGHADAIYFYEPSQNNPYLPPNGVEVYKDTPDAGTVNEIENPNSQAGTNNWWVQDGYGAGGNGGYPPPYTTSPVYGGGSYSNCADSNQPGVGPIVGYLEALGVNPRCEKGRYYLLNNYNPGYFGNGKNAYTDHNPSNTPFTIPPSSVPSIGDDLNAHNVSWKYYGDQWNNYVPDPYQINYGTNGPDADEYCNICNPFQYDTSIMANPTVRAAHIQDTLNLYDDISSGHLPAVSVVKPSGYVDGHPASSKLDLFEGFTKKIVDLVLASPYAKDTAIFITEDEGGGYYDSGYVQPLDFFGDGTRIIFLIVAPYLKSPGLISHEYADHVSILKFIERNWNLPPITTRSRDNFPNPVAAPDTPYVPRNGPAISDLFDFFDFGH